MPTADGRIPMSDGAGVVEAVGEGVTEFAVGDRVVSCFFPGWHDGPPAVADFSTVPGDGVDGYAREAVVRPATWFTRAPEGYSHAEAATLTTAGLTAWRALVVEGGLKAGDVVLALGTGGVSVFALQLAKAMGAAVIVTSSSDEKLERARALGADHTVNYRRHADWGEPRGRLDRRARRRPRGRGRRAGHAGAVDRGGARRRPHRADRRADRARGRGADRAADAQAGPPAGPDRRQPARADRLRARHRGDGLRPVVDRGFPLAEIADAFRHEEAGAHFGKICLEEFPA